MKRRIIKELKGSLINDNKLMDKLTLKFTFKTNQLVKNAQVLDGKKDMRKKFIKSSMSTYTKPIVKALDGLLFASYTNLPTYNVLLLLDNPFSSYNYPSTVSKELAEDDTDKLEQPVWVLNIIPNNSNISFALLIKEEGLPVKITSGYRGKNDFRGGLTVKGTRSNHNKLDADGNPMAYDIVPTSGNFSQLLNSIYSNPRVVQWFKDKNWGILDETNPATMAKTGATGKHLHIGPDSIAVLQFNNRIAKGQEGLKFVSYEPSTTPEVDTSTLVTPTFDNSTSLNLLDEFLNDESQNKILEVPVTSKADFIGDTQINFPLTDNLDIYHKFGTTKNKYKEFVDVMTPIFKKALYKNGYPTSSVDNLIKQSALESGYGLNTRGSKGFNLGGVKYVGLKGYTGSQYSDGNKYVDFNNLMDYADYYVKLLNNKYNALSTNSTADFVNRLHGLNSSNAKYSTTDKNKYASMLNGMTSLNKYLV